MQQCDVCHSDMVEVYAVDEFVLCETCFQGGRISELPGFQKHRAIRLEEDQAYTGWWNRERLPW